MGPAQGPGTVENPLDKSGLCLLSLDGGGVRGLSSLRILQRLMAKVNSERDAAGLSPVKPCQLFDLIGGTGTGGLSAIMLGRLEMDVDQCITEYSRMISQIFKKKTLPLDWRGEVRGRFDSNELTNSIKQTMKKFDFSESELLDNGKWPTCKVFVCATSFETKSIVRLKSYRLVDDSDVRPTILEATSAATSFFDPATIGNRRYIDGALGANCPVDEVWNEAQNIWCAEDGALEKLISCFVSIGTGHPGVTEMHEGALKVLAEDMVKIATQAERTAETFEARSRGLSDRNRYFRFTVAQGLQGVGLEEYKKEGQLEAATDDYLATQSQKIRLRRCVGNLKEKTKKSPSDLARIIRRHNTASMKQKTVEPTKVHSADPRFIQNVSFVGRQQELASIKHQFKSARERGELGHVCLWGPGGAGKTQLAAKYAHQFKKDYSDIFKISAHSQDSIEEDFANIYYEVCSTTDDSSSSESSSSELDPQMKQAIMKKNIRAVHRWFAKHQTNDWLLIIDNVKPTGVDVGAYIPRTQQGDIIMTTQSRHFGGAGFLIEIGELSPKDSITLLFDKAKVRDEKSKLEMYPQAAEVVKELGYLALAVEQAGALIWHKGMSSYRESFRSDRLKVLDSSEFSLTRHDSVYKTFQLSFNILLEPTKEETKDEQKEGKKVEKKVFKNLPAGKLLVLLSFLDNTTISEDLLFPNGKPNRTLTEHVVLKNRLEFQDAVAELHALALVYRTERAGSMVLSLHPLVHYMSRARLTVNNRFNWTRNAGRFLLAPLLDPSSAQASISYASFKHLQQVLQQAMALETEPLSSPRSCELWAILTLLMAVYYTYWHLHGRMEEFDRYCKHAVSVLEHATDDSHGIWLANAVQMRALSVEYTNTYETSMLVMKRFLAMRCTPATAAALDYARDMTKTNSASRNLASPRVSLGPLSLGRVLQGNATKELLTWYVQFLRRASFWHVGCKRWNEALLLSELSELPVTIWGRPVVTVSPRSSDLVRAAFNAASSYGLDEYLHLLHQLAQASDGTYSHGALYDYCKIISRQGRHTEAESAVRKFLTQFNERSQLTFTTAEETFYMWATKTLAMALIGQGRHKEAWSTLVDASALLKIALGNDNLSQLHSLMLLIFHHTECSPDVPPGISEYQAELSVKFRSMYATSSARILKAEGFQMGCVLIAQGGIEEAIMVIREFVNASVELLGRDHELTLRATRVLQVAISDSEQEAENVKNGDYWLHFGSMTFQRDVSGIGLEEKDRLELASKEASWRELAASGVKRSEKNRFKGLVDVVRANLLLTSLLCFGTLFAIFLAHHFFDSRKVAVWTSLSVPVLSWAVFRWGGRLRILSLQTKGS